ncbi:MAG: hypothetical protein A2Y03_07545 [Omnitrophica WOR_2 bacterium GWF2_38_59]|nr:MAG: hypothetical protein A2Y03_07545 [Omnitrophica WOR_2 bacterium GWF2_38_59]OGX48806.1 MAG: hypothetical protein A2243_08985 [Omnitrophica WOR_2 bacterium RIFOXYA2_FULL_38_17]OGX53099.1 MAG: hypothetical protein A2267_10955 [Omnitrophica WOR_2 bacterium RIFOXYA12_FULL_38_10]OGX58550.1 MAG: hypothetical protein A2447_11080 [Omnitrophica WOR_2 bacterium RIFOXYC2_FULL_38_12]OGX58822.1 MAG: hypothetical protein A2306_12510 [Omnitrophica WOR_2 bacterium RIFOXYB2_FULL_38_16]HBG60851.1 sigma-54
MDKINKNEFKLLIVDDEPLIRESLYEIFRIEGYNVQMAATAEDALQIMKKVVFDIVVTDFKLPLMSGLDLLLRIKEQYEKTEVILMTGYGSIGTAVDAMKKGAYDYITKPINDNEIKIIIDKIIDKKKIILENEELKRILAQERRSSFGMLIGGSEKMQKVYHMIDSVASTNATILITGESGTGKGVLARALHDADLSRADKPFVEVSCGALTETLLESELFGHVKGAFTGAIKDKEGRFEFAKGGTIFLDEIDAFSPNLQVKLLKVLQDGIFERVGDNITRKADARIIVATNQHLTDLVEKGEFREDLYYRVNVIAIQMPPLRGRDTDVEALMEHFREKYCSINKKNIKGFSEDVIKVFKDYQWPGNVRELENAVEGSVIMAKGNIIELGDVIGLSKFIKDGESNGQVKVGDLLKKAVEEPEKEHIISVLDRCGWNRSNAAVALGINRTTLYNKMKKYGLLNLKK